MVNSPLAELGNCDRHNLASFLAHGRGSAYDPGTVHPFQYNVIHPALANMVRREARAKQDRQCATDFLEAIEPTIQLDNTLHQWCTALEIEHPGKGTSNVNVLLYIINAIRASDDVVIDAEDIGKVLFIVAEEMAGEGTDGAIQLDVVAHNMYAFDGQPLARMFRRDVDTDKFTIRMFDSLSMVKRMDAMEPTNNKLGTCVEYFNGVEGAIGFNLKNGQLHSALFDSMALLSLLYNMGNTDGFKRVCASGRNIWRNNWASKSRKRVSGGDAVSPAASATSSHEFSLAEIETIIQDKILSDLAQFREITTAWRPSDLLTFHGTLIKRVQESDDTTREKLLNKNLDSISGISDATAKRIRGSLGFATIEDAVNRTVIDSILTVTGKTQLFEALLAHITPSWKQRVYRALLGILHESIMRTGHVSPKVFKLISQWSLGVVIQPGPKG